MLLIVPCSEPGRGGGHLTRCITLTRDLRSLNKEAMLFIVPQTRDLSGLYNSLDFNPAWCITKAELDIRIENLKEKVDFIILDKFETPHDELLDWKKIAPVIGIDEGGKYRDEFDFLIDMLIPEGFIKPAANIYSPKLLIKNLTTNHTNHTNSLFKILISFGQEDNAGLSIKTARSISEMNDSLNWDITLLRGNLANGLVHTPKNVKVLDSIPNLSEHLHEYDLVITHYGLTAYEALFSKTRVLLAHPTKYHKKIAKAAGFETIGEKNFTTNRTYGSFKNTTNLLSDIEEKVREGTLVPGLNGSWLIKEKETLVELCANISPIVNRSCAVCGEEVSKNSVARFNDRTYRRCAKCGVINMDRINEPQIEYEIEYFFKSYAKQYGKTYLEDFENIKEAGKSRLKIIKTLLPLRASVVKTYGFMCESLTLPILLDIGCAYGPFLAAAKEEGFSPVGIDPAEGAVQYVNEKLSIPAIHALFPIPHSVTPNSYILPSTQFDVVTLWYVIEHFRDCVSVLAEIKKILKPKNSSSKASSLLAFSTPSFSGISGRKSLNNFLSESPADHFTIWSPKMVKKALSLAGFKVKKIVVIGHHPERFPVFGKLAKNKKGLVYKMLLCISKTFGLGDTFEVYAEMI